MKLDFAALAQPVPKPRGRAGTSGTPAFMRVPTSARIGDRAGKPGDKTAGNGVPSGIEAGDMGVLIAVPVECPHSPPVRFHGLGTRKPNIPGASPVSPLVPAGFMKDTARDTLDREGFEQRAAIMEFDGGLFRDKSQRLAMGDYGDKYDN
jgi:hypothetical protein